jgi:ABC-type Zn uptake system ZnuABC Zn-binding protein ZnuA
MDGSSVGIMVKLLLLVAVTTIAMVVSACGSSNQSSSDAFVDVVTTSNIAEDWVQRIGGTRVSVFSLVPTGADPHAFQPGARDVTRVADADVIISMGLGLEKGWLEDMLDTASSDSGVLVALGEVTGPITIGDQGSEVLDPHFWFDPLRVKLAIAEIALTMTALDPEGAQNYRDNTIAYLQELDELHAWAQGILAMVPADRRVLVTSHDTLGYFADRYDYEVVGTLVPGVTTDGEPSARDLTDLVDVVTELGVPAIFVENTTSDRLAKRIAEEADVDVVSSLFTGSLSAKDKGADTYITMMRTNITAIVEALR